ncbi:2-Methylisocitrate lyase, PEP mutase family [Streptomyces sp. DvalAA-14]|uniref:isocitrate lyase/PEP mutase family protein n=1 Tax=unclassified Streptomyces TaxID=2593676 RepID=UPI00081B9798|nr:MULTISPECIES: isocitrate lyase/phosphoenolpyruvate mutase family protein [unclassified Streptomyces]MYS23761.1 isocitrate lyase/phosphoenolpyruvate mutase family protein [Streptomyces sp. SID4948]SCE38401.1 2-Methylisocitrate lyase, PEP mutase family [Streptomyces sp. DvalAA-14]
MTALAFRALHQGRTTGHPLVLPGPWDAASAQALADAGFPALATPSAGIAASLGYADGSTPPEEMFAAVARIVRAVPVPVSADIEGGYGLAPGELVGRLLEAGAVGCNLEDSEGHSTLKDPQRHADWLAEVRAAAGDALFINARVDTFLFGTGDPADAVARARLYVAAGADCVYPLLAPLEAFPALREGIEGPINMAARPDRESVAELTRAGATRITFGPGMQRHAAEATGALGAGLRG